jgi:hypothetical protein
MARIKSTTTPNSSKRRRPATTPEARENQLISLAIDLVEKRLIEGTASSQETTHFLKLATPKAKLERQILEAERDLKIAKRKDLESQQEIKELYSEALKAMRNYSGNGDEDEY